MLPAVGSHSPGGCPNSQIMQSHLHRIYWHEMASAVMSSVGNDGAACDPFVCLPSWTRGWGLKKPRPQRAGTEHRIMRVLHEPQQGSELESSRVVPAHMISCFVLGRAKIQ